MIQIWKSSDPHIRHNKTFLGLKIYNETKTRRGGSNEYPQSMFWSKNKKIGISLHTPVYCIKVGYKGVFISLTCFTDADL